MQIYCRVCNAQIVAEDIDLPLRMAKCRKCHAVFGIAEVLAAEGIGVPAAPAKPLQPNPPEYAVVEEWGSDLSVWYRWADWSVLFMIFFCTFWDGFLVAIYGAAVVSWLNGQPVQWVGLLFPLGHLAVGIGITYGTLCHLLNLTWIQLSMQTLTIRHGPIPVWGNQVLDTREVDQFFIAHGTGWRQKGQASYCLSALLKDGTRLELVTHCDGDLLLWLEHKLEEKLKITDRAVPGEIDW
jgi:hypothetical protein